MIQIPDPAWKRYPDFPAEDYNDEEEDINSPWTGEVMAVYDP